MRFTYFVFDNFQRLFYENLKMIANEIMLINNVFKILKINNKKPDLNVRETNKLLKNKQTLIVV
jgi:hypothetical protein